MDISANEKLLAFMQRYERLNDEIDGLNADKADLCKEMKGLGYDVKAFKSVAAKRRKHAKDPQAADELDAVMESYEIAIAEAEARAAVPARARTHESRGVAA